jgi:predicted RNA-binding Zn-ribbon protein involved in translation (DUF1610 family)
MKDLTIPCPLCGTQNIVKSDAEITFCTTCGGKIELGIHSYRTEESAIPNFFCISCGQVLSPEIAGSIFSCKACGGIVCVSCANMHENKRYCRNCNRSISKPVKEKKSAISNRTKGNRKSKKATGNAKSKKSKSKSTKSKRTKGRIKK